MSVVVPNGYYYYYASIYLTTFNFKLFAPTVNHLNLAYVVCICKHSQHFAALSNDKPLKFDYIT